MNRKCEHCGQALVDPEEDKKATARAMVLVAVYTVFLIVVGAIIS